MEYCIIYLYCLLRLISLFLASLVPLVLFISSYLLSFPLLLIFYYGDLARQAPQWAFNHGTTALDTAEQLALTVLPLCTHITAVCLRSMRVLYVAV